MKLIVKILFGIACIGSFSNVDAQMQTGSFEFEGRTRNYHVFLPQNYQTDMPVVLNLHGFGWTPAGQADNTLIHELADTSGFIIAYPAGSSVEGRTGWNNGLRNHPFGVTDTTSNDVGFISALIDTLDAHYDIDLSRVYSCGFSMGGEMTYRLAIELGHRFAAIASVAGKLNDVSGNLGDPVRPFPVLHFHGTADSVERYDGIGDGNLWPVEEVINFWVDHNNCVFEPDTLSLPDIDPDDGCTVERISFTNCSGSGHVIFYKVLNGGHNWPGVNRDNDPQVNMDIHAGQVVWDFFSRHTLAQTPEPEATGEAPPEATGVPEPEATDAQ